MDLVTFPSIQQPPRGLRRDPLGPNLARVEILNMVRFCAIDNAIFGVVKLCGDTLVSTIFTFFTSYLGFCLK